MKFTYKALRNGQPIRGTLEAEDEKNVVDYLKSSGLFVLEISTATSSWLPSMSSGLFNRVKFADLVDFTRQLSIMLNSGLSIADSLDILRKQAQTPALKKMITEINEEIQAGNSFSSALKKYGDVFSRLYIALVKAGEASGKLDEIMKKLAGNLEKQRSFQGKMKGALIYPAIVIVAMMGVMFIMITFVVPQLLSLYKDFNIVLPLPTRILIFVSGFMQKFWILVIAAVFAISTLVGRYAKTRIGHKRIDSIVLRIPLIKRVVRISALVNSTRTLAILVNAGVPILQALDIIIETTGNVVYQEAFKTVKIKVEKGASLGKSLDEEGIFPPIFVQMTLVGEKTGHLDETLMHLSKYFESEAEMAIKAVTILIEPAILIILGFAVGFVVLAVITPIFSLSNAF